MSTAVKRKLGFMAVVPSADPISLAFNVASAAIAGFTAVLKIAHRARDERYAQENAVVAQQEKLKGIMANVVAAQYDPATTPAQLVDLRAQLATAGQQFLEYAQQFPVAGPSAIETIFGVSDGNGGWTPTADAPGWFTRVLGDLDKAIGEKIMDPAIGFDWNRLEHDLVNIGSAVVSKVTKTPVSTIAATTAINSGSSIPSWLLPVGIGLGAYMLWNMRQPQRNPPRRRRRR